MTMITITVNKSENGSRVDKYLKKIMPGITTGLLFKQIRKKNITLNENKIQGDEIIHAGDIINIFFSDETFDKFSSSQESNSEESNPLFNEGENAYKKFSNIKILYEDDNFLFVNKPAGVLSQKATPKDLSINEWIIGYLYKGGNISKSTLKIFRPSVMNRLDRNTSGIILCAKTLSGSIKLAELIKKHAIRKYYRTFLYGDLKGQNINIAYLSKDESTNSVKVINQTDFDKLATCEKDKYSCIKTGYKSLSIFNNYNLRYTYAEIELFTGKSHQIRANFAHLGHPILGDTKYGNKNTNKIMQGLGIKHQLLHAYRIEFPEDNGDFVELNNLCIVCEEPEYYVHLQK